MESIRTKPNFHSIKRFRTELKSILLTVMLVGQHTGCSPVAFVRVGSENRKDHHKLSQDDK